MSLNILASSDTMDAPLLSFQEEDDISLHDSRSESPDETSAADLADSITVNVKEKSGGAAMETLKKVLHQIMGESTESSQDLRLLVVGKTGEGKSTLVNSIINFKKLLAEEGDGTEICTLSVQQYLYPNVIPDVNFTVIDSPGLQDIHKAEQSYIHEMKNKCQEVSLILYCMKMTTHRLTNDDKLAMQKLHQAFGPKFWERVVFVLTFANKEDCDRRGNRDRQLPSNASDAQIFDNRIQIFASKVKEFLFKTIGVELDTVHCVPAGDYRVTKSQPDPLQLPDRENWLYELLKKCCLQIKHHNFMKISLNDRIHLAIVLDNDGEGKDGQIEATLEKRGFCVLYFNGLNSESIACLLESLQHVDHSELASFALVILSKGKTHHVYDVNNEEVSFDDLFRHFENYTDIAKVFFFHLAHQEMPKGSFVTMTLPKNSIALTVSVKHASDNNCSPAMEAFSKNLSDSKPLKQCFEEIRDSCANGAEVFDTLDDDYVLPTPYEPTSDKQEKIFARRKLGLYHTLLYSIRRKTIKVLHNTKDKVLEILHAERATKIATSSTSIAVGGGLVVAGIAAAPFTFGASLGLTVAGGVVGAAAGTGGIIASIASRVKSNRQLKKAQQHIRLDQQLSRIINDAAVKLNESKMMQAPELASDVTVGGIQTAAGVGRFGMAAAAGFEGAVEGGALAFRSAGNAVGAALAGATLAITVPMDIGLIAYNSYLLHQSSKDKSGKSDRSNVIKWFVKQIEVLLKDILFGFDMVKHDIEGDLVITFDRPEHGYKVSVPANINKTSISVRTILSGPFNLPEGATLVSAVYDVLMEEKLQAPVTIEIEHCVDITDQSTAEMTFATATLDFDQMVFVFTPLEGGTFPQGQTHGSISLSDSSLLCILYYSESQQDQLMIKYAAQCSTTRECRNYWRKNITFTKCLSAHHKYIQLDAAPAVDNVSDHPFKFKSADLPRIELRNFKCNIRINGWLISPDSTEVIPDEIHKQKIDTAELPQDSHKPPSSDMFPSLTLDIQVEDEERASDELRFSTDMIMTGIDLKLDITQQKD